MKKLNRQSNLMENKCTSSAFIVKELISLPKIFVNKQELLVHIQSHLSPQESIQKFLNILEGNKPSVQDTQTHSLEIMANHLQNQMIELMQKHSQETLKKMKEIAQESLKSQITSNQRNEKLNQEDEVFSRKLKRDYDLINQQMEEKIRNHEQMFENFTENMRTVFLLIKLTSDIRDMREQNYMNLKEKAELDAILKNRQIQPEPKTKAKNRKEETDFNQKFIKEATNPQNELFKDDSNKLKGDQSLPTHHLGSVTKQDTKKLEVKKDYIGEIEADKNSEFSQNLEDISIGNIEREIDELENKDFIKKSEPQNLNLSTLDKTKENKQNENNPSLKTKNNPIIIGREEDNQIHINYENEEFSDEENSNEILMEKESSGSINSEKIREAERRFQEILNAKGKNDFDNQKLKSLAEERLQANLQRTSPLLNNDDINSKLELLQKNLALVNQSLLLKTNDESLKQRIQQQDDKFIKEVKIKLDEFRKQSGSLKESFRKEINLD